MPMQAQGKGDLGDMRRWIVSTTPRTLYPVGKDQVSILQEAICLRGEITLT